MTDILARYPVKQVHAWYLRLAAMTAKNPVNGHTPLSAQFLKAYLNNKNASASITFTAPPYLKSFPKIRDGLLYHRRVFLTEEKARLGSGKKWAGLVPRLKDGRWNGVSSLTMGYESLVEIGSGYADVVRIQLNGTPQERDLFTSLRGFQLRSDVTVTGKRTGDIVDVTFKRWMAQAKDRYDWNYKEYLTMPNPDFGSRQKDAIEPKQRSFRVYHKNAKRMEDARLAAPYDLVVGPWQVTDPLVLKTAKVDANKKL